MPKDVTIRIKVKDQMSRGLKSASATLGRFREKANSAFKTLLSGKSIMVGVAAGAAALGLAIKKAFEFERYRTQFKVLFGDIEQAKEHIKSLQQFSASTPFQFADIATASRQLHVFTGGVMGAEESLRLVGDAAAASGQPIQDVGMWVGRAYSSIQAGRPFGEAAMRLQEMGILSGEARNKMEQLQKAGASNVAVWSVLQGELQKSNGGMAELSQTGEGLFSTLKDNWSLALARFGDSFMLLAKDGIGNLTDKIKQLMQDGTIDVWAERAKNALEGLLETAKFVGKALEKLGAVKKFVERVSAAVGSKAGGGSFAEGWEMVDDWDEQQRQDEERIRAAAAKRAEANKAAAAQEKSLQERIVQDLGKKRAEEGKKAVEQVAETEAMRTMDGMLSKLEQSQQNAETVSGQERELGLENVEVRKDSDLSAVKDIEGERVGIGLSNIETRKEAELAAIREVEEERARLRASMSSGGATGPDGSDRNFNLTAIIQAEKMAQVQAAAMAEALGPMFSEALAEANEPIIGHLAAIRDNTASTAETIRDAITLSE